MQYLQLPKIKVIQVASNVTFYPCLSEIPQIRKKTIKLLKTQNVVTF